MEDGTETYGRSTCLPSRRYVRRKKWSHSLVGARSVAAFLSRGTALRRSGSAALGGAVDDERHSSQINNKRNGLQSITAERRVSPRTSFPEDHVMEANHYAASAASYQTGHCSASAQVNGKVSLPCALSALFPPQ